MYEPSETTVAIVERMKLSWYKPPPIGVLDRESTTPRRKRKSPDSVRMMEVGPYVVRSEVRGFECTVKLYENIPGKTKLIATRHAFSLFECRDLFRKIVDVINELRYERRTKRWEV